MNDLFCPNCNNKIIKSDPHEAKMRIKLIKWNRDGMFAVCKGCGNDVPVEIEFLKSLQLQFSFVIDGQNKA